MEGHFEGVEDVHALDISKRLMDYGIHPPTNYFPLIVPEALLIEPTETEDKATLDNFIDVMKTIARKPTTSRNCCTTRRTSRRSSGWTRCAPPSSWCSAAARSRSGRSALIP